MGLHFDWLPRPLIKRIILSCRTIQFDELLRGLSMNGFRMGDELKTCFQAVDVDRSGGLEFSEVEGVVRETFVFDSII